MWLLLALATAPSFATAPVEEPAEAPDPRLLAESTRLQSEMVLLARRSAWSGVDRAYRDLLALGAPLDLEAHDLGAQASRALGDAWGAYQRLLRVIAIGGPEVTGHGEMEGYRTAYGRVTVRRVEETPISLVAASPPFQPDLRLAISYAAEQLATTGGFDGMLPVGAYQLGDHELVVGPGLAPTVLIRVAGDGDLGKKSKRKRPPELPAAPEAP